MLDVYLCKDASINGSGREKKDVNKTFVGLLFKNSVDAVFYVLNYS